ncbi:hypothetical protein F5887DRAFT_982453 [Amanita rubescens]|nr:hypothetical protein F5887DRAFT_992888 [Amanita rubescens]KAF8338692.1 hypothetical protein F5887DRAFT_982453 [Amanita rubescens]
MLEDVMDARAPWMTDVLVRTINGEYANKLAKLSTPDSEARLKLATEMFLKQVSISGVMKKSATAVDESLSKQQKVFFLRQLVAIQRELSALRRCSSEEGGAGGNSSELDDNEKHEADNIKWIVEVYQWHKYILGFSNAW